MKSVTFALAVLLISTCRAYPVEVDKVITSEKEPIPLVISEYSSVVAANEPMAVTTMSVEDVKVESPTTLEPMMADAPEEPKATELPAMMEEEKVAMEEEATEASKISESMEGRVASVVSNEPEKVEASETVTEKMAMEEDPTTLRSLLGDAMEEKEPVPSEMLAEASEGVTTEAAEAATERILEDDMVTIEEIKEIEKNEGISKTEEVDMKMEEPVMNAEMSTDAPKMEESESPATDVPAVRERRGIVAEEPSVSAPVVEEVVMEEVKLPVAEGPADLPSEEAKKEEPIMAEETPMVAEESPKGETPVMAEESPKEEIPMMAEETPKGETPIMAEESVKEETPIMAEETPKVEIPAMAEESPKEEAPVMAEESPKVEAPVMAEESPKEETPMMAEEASKDDSPVMTEAPKMEAESPTTSRSSESSEESNE